MKPEIVIEENKEELTAKLAADIIEIIKNAGRDIHISLSGGSTPEALYKYLAENYSGAIDWSKVYFWWGDERCVPPDNSESNYKMAKDAMLDSLKVPEKNIFRIKGEENPESEVGVFEEIMKKYLPQKNSIPVYDIVLLGMGDDGHTVSIFPDQIELFNSERFAEIAVHPQTGQKRITITGKVVNNAEHVFFMVTGSKKSEIVNEILNKTGNYKSYPAALVEPEDGELIWYLDSEASEIYRNIKGD